ncbi:unnamed protein product [Blepharisma stoltei]|uniref:Uncharacterized protein n=1 Tax=Blepharisma stoltei TaxID=1481888 RepID=A0AAU9JDH7_9CILI|nr:unnamed protein product [Blepharisma stoltei]
MIPEIKLPKNTEYSQIETKTLRFTRCYSNKRLYIFDVECKKQTVINLPLNHDFKNYGTKCLLPDGSLFYYDDNHLVLVDSLNNIKFLPSYKREKIWAGSFYCNGYIYLIGQRLKYSGRYGMKENRWYSIASPFNESVKSQVCTLYGNIAFFGSHSANNVIIYDIIADSYSELQFKSQDDGYIGFMTNNKS